MTALFALEGQIFAKHSAPEAAVHRDLVKAGRWSTDLGRDFSFCAELRGVGDYGADVRVDAKQATDAIGSARRILVAIATTNARTRVLQFGHDRVDPCPDATR